MIIRRETPADAIAVDTLIDAAFGPARLVKAVERLREGGAPASEACVVAEDDDGALVGAVRQWPIRIGGAASLLLGPIAVAHGLRGEGVGAALMEAACAAADQAGASTVLLVGDLGYFERWGFARAGAGSVTLPGPVDSRRVLMRCAGEPPGGIVTRA